MNNENKPKPHPNAHWIKLWADGIPIEHKSWTGRWVDVINLNIMTMHDTEYRIKPINKTWKPGRGEKYYFLVVNEGKIYVKDRKWWDNEIDDTLYRQHNIFPTKEEGEFAIPRVIDALKDTINVVTDKKYHELEHRYRTVCEDLFKANEELKMLQTRCDNLYKVKEQLIASHAAVDGVTLTDGEIALIKAMREFRIGKVHDNLSSVLVTVTDCGDGFIPTAANKHVSFYPLGSQHVKPIVDALRQIKKEQE